MTIVNLVLEFFKFCIQTPDILILNFNPLKIKLKANKSKLSYNINNIGIHYLKDLSNMYFWSEVNTNCTSFSLLSFFLLDFTLQGFNEIIWCFINPEVFKYRFWSIYIKFLIEFWNIQKLNKNIVFFFLSLRLSHWVLNVSMFSRSSCWSLIY